MNEPKTIKVLHCPYLVGGNPYGLAKAERGLGLDSVCLAVTQNYLNYPADRVFSGCRASLPAKLWARLRMFRELFREYDIIHYNFGSGALSVPLSKDVTGCKAAVKNLLDPFLLETELKFVRKAGKKIFVTYQGSDARPARVLYKQYSISLPQPPDRCITAIDRTRRAMIDTFDKYASGIFYLNPDLHRFLPARAEFMPYAHIDCRSLEPVFPGGERPFLLHVPTNRNIKGTDAVLAAVDQLKREGFDFDFSLIENLSNREAMDIYRKADILIDQLKIGWYGGIAVEFMALGKCVVCYLNDEDLAVIPARMKQDIPIVNTDSGHLCDALRNLLRDRALLTRIGQASRRYAELWHDPLQAASHLKDLYQRSLGILPDPPLPAHP